MATNPQTAAPEVPIIKAIGDKTLNGIGNLIKILPTGTVFLFQFLSPVLTNNGHCTVVNKYLTGALLIVCGLSCCFSCFTDSYTGADGKIYYGIVTRKGLWPFWDPNKPSDMSDYRLRLGDFVHALYSIVVFMVIALLDSNTVSCFYPILVSSEKVLLMVLPPVVGVISSLIFGVFPNTRHGIGYPPSTSSTAA